MQIARAEVNQKDVLNKIFKHPNKTLVGVALYFELNRFFDLNTSFSDRIQARIVRFGAHGSTKNKATIFLHIHGSGASDRILR